MWMFFGVAAGVMTLINLSWAALKRDPRWFRYLALAFTALAVCAFYQDVNMWVQAEAWETLQQTVPTTAKGLWLLTGSMVVLNSYSLFPKKEEHRL